MKFIACILSLWLLILVPSPQVKKPVDWCKLDSLVLKDTILTPSNKISYQVLQDIPDIDDERYKALEKTPFFEYIEDKLLPLL